jgi:hypothetical protein
MAGGRRVGSKDRLEAARERFGADLGRLPEPPLDLQEPRAPQPAMSAALAELTERTRRPLAARAAAP